MKTTQIIKTSKHQNIKRAQEGTCTDDRTQEMQYESLLIFSRPELVEEYASQPGKFGPGKPPARGLLCSVQMTIQIQIQKLNILNTNTNTKY